jgi:hypothetical protein
VSCVRPCADTYRNVLWFYLVSFDLPNWLWFHSIVRRRGQVGDLLDAINGESCRAMTVRDAVPRLTGPHVITQPLPKLGPLCATALLRHRLLTPSEATGHLCGSASVAQTAERRATVEDRDATEAAQFDAAERRAFSHEGCGTDTTRPLPSLSAKS